MLFGFAMMAVGYAIFYWGLHHFPQYKDSRYSLWTLLGLGAFNLPQGTPIQFKS
jgi:hypothetical protein